MDGKRCLEIIGRYSREYQKQIMRLAPAINRVARYVPGRRKRKLHIGLFGYSRSMGRIRLPRVITFTCALYSMGLPPELLGLNALTRNDLRLVRENYVNFEDDMRDALAYFNPDTGLLPKGLKAKIRELQIDFQPDEEHKEITGHILSLLKGKGTEELRPQILRAAHFRRFLG